MANRRKKLWILNLIIVFTLVVCGLAFAMHYKNWMQLRPTEMRILSGIYYTRLPYNALNDVEMVDRLPSMERLNGFSAGMVEKGVFRDSLYPDRKVYVYVDNLRHPKIRLVHHDSLVLFLNLKDSTETHQLFSYLQIRKDSVKAGSAGKK